MKIKGKNLCGALKTILALMVKHTQGGKQLSKSKQLVNGKHCKSSSFYKHKAHSLTLCSLLVVSNARISS